MHVEFRLSEIAHTCAFDPESFYRMKQILASRPSAGHSPSAAFNPSRVGSRAGPAAPPEAGLRELRLIDLASYASERSQSRASAKRQGGSMWGGRSAVGAADDLFSEQWRPEIRVQFVFEGLFKLESSDLTPSLDGKQHDKQVSTNWDGSVVRTKRYSVSPKEILLTALPASVMDCVVKIRLLQLPPDLGSAALERRVERAIGVRPGDASQRECLRDTPLCIGVAKITLRELITVRGGVCIALQPKGTVLRAVEAMNLNTVATNGMFGKDVGGSSFFTFQAIAFTFGKVPASKLLMYKKRTPERLNDSFGSGSASRRDDESMVGRDFHADPGSVSRQASLQPVRMGGSSGIDTARMGLSPSTPPFGGSETVSMGRPDSYGARLREWQGTSHVAVGSFDTAAVRFVMIPHMTLVDLLLKVHDLVAWRRPKRTLILVMIMLLVLAADAMDIALLVIGFSMVVSAARTMTVLYRVPVTETGAGPLTSTLSPDATEESHAYLYARHNTMLNALVRARLFFTQGLQEDSYYELILIFHTIRRNERHIILSGAAVCASMCLFSLETVLLLSLFSLFVAYPIAVRIPAIHPRKSKRKNFAPPTLHGVMKGWRLGAPMRVVRVVQVSIAPAPPVVPTLQINGQVPSIGAGPSMDRQADLALPAFTGGSRAPSEVAASSALGRFDGTGGPPNTHRRAPTVDYGSPLSAAVERQQNQNASRLTYAVVSFNCEAGGMVANKANPCGPLVAKLQRHFALARYLYDSDSPGLHVSGGVGGTPRGPIMRSSSNYTASPAVGAGSNPFGGGSSELLSPTYIRTPLGPAPQTQASAFRSFFAETVNLLTFITHGCVIQTFLSPAAEGTSRFGASASSSSAAPSSGNERVPLEFFARQEWLVERARDDGISATMYAMSRNTLVVKKLQKMAGIDNEARALALLGAYLLQGSCLSVYSAGPSSNTCSVIVPLDQGTSRVKALPQPNPCPPRLFQALDEIWRGPFAQNSASTSGITITANSVLQIISAHKDEKYARLSGVEASPNGDDMQLALHSMHLQRGDSVHHASPRTNFMHSVTGAFSSAGHPQQLQRQQSGAFGRQATIGQANSYGALGHSRDPSSLPANVMPQTPVMPRQRNDRLWH